MLEAETKLNRKRRETRKLLNILGAFLLLFGLVLTFFTFKDILIANINYSFRDKDKKVVVKIEDEISTEEVKSEDEVVFIDKDFGLYIPKIDANSQVIKNVDPYSRVAYDKALEKGVAHAIGSSVPSVKGNTFLFAHSAVDFYESRKYNVYFYLLNKLEKGDEIYVSYGNIVYKYVVDVVKVVNPTQVEYLDDIENRDTLTLMTCWPAGLNFKRVIVVADKVGIED